MSRKILIFGKGFVGTRLKEALDCDASAKKIYSYKEAQEEIKRFNPKIVINCIGHTGSNVDECEQDKEKTLCANAFVPLI
ncbi:MAG: hypothetical protein JW788_01270, partial [Candidatus Omnitrophica bacterium]|nr:hypothetical protein [Candidatus Omnitrophota bacterium]